MKKFTTAILAGSALLLFTACGGGGGSSDGGTTPPSTVSANGLWSGTQTINGVAYDIQAIVYNGRIEGYSIDTQTMFSGSYSMSGSTMNSNFLVYDVYGDPMVNGSMQGNVSEGSTFTANYSNDAGQTGVINTTFDNRYYESSSLGYIAGNYISNTQDFSISSTGYISGRTNGCSINGNVAIPDPSVNVYQINYALSNCIYEGNYNGLGTIITYTDGTYIQAGMQSASRMDLFIAKI